LREVGRVERYVADGDTREDENGEEGSCKRGQAPTVHDERAGGLRAA